MVSAAVKTSITPLPVDFRDVQGLIRFGHGKLTRTCFYALRIRDAATARSWLREVPVTTAETLSPPPSSALQVALTAGGLKSLGVPESIVRSFSAEFLSGMADESNRSRRLGDVGINAPSNWRWGSGARVPDLLVMAFATESAWESAEAITRTAEWSAAFETIACLHGDLDGREPFGFADGLSQPELDWEQSRVVRSDEPAFTNLSALGEFVLGYRNEYGEFTERPLIDPMHGIALPPALDAPGKLDLGRHGTYLVLRELHQDVRGFWNYLSSFSKSPDDARTIAEAMVGRRIDGAPLVHTDEHSGHTKAEAKASLNQFDFSSDPDGLQCPRGAHIRRANPRTADFAGPTRGPLSRLLHRLGFGACGLRDDRVASTRFHRVLRRGRRFGPAVTPEAAISESAGGPERGLYFICLNTNISRQFEFIQNAWLMSASFDGLNSEPDPLLGRRDDDGRGGKSDTFTIPDANGAPRRLYGVPDFVTVRGGAYFFLPGVKALRYLATVGE